MKDIKIVLGYTADGDLSVKVLPSFRDATDLADAYALLNTLGENYVDVRQAFAQTYAQLKLAKTTDSKKD